MKRLLIFACLLVILASTVAFSASYTYKGRGTKNIQFSVNGPGEVTLQLNKPLELGLYGPIVPLWDGMWIAEEQGYSTFGLRALVQNPGAYNAFIFPCGNINWTLKITTP